MRFQGDKRPPSQPDAVEILGYPSPRTHWWDAPHLGFRQSSDKAQRRLLITAAGLILLGPLILVSSFIWGLFNNLSINDLNSNPLGVLWITLWILLPFVGLAIPSLLVFYFRKRFPLPYEIEGDHFATYTPIGWGPIFGGRKQKIWLAHVTDIQVGGGNIISQGEDASYGVDLTLASGKHRMASIHWYERGMSVYDFAVLLRYRVAKAKGEEPPPSKFTLEYDECMDGPPPPELL